VVWLTDNDIFSKKMFELADKIRAFVINNFKKLEKKGYDLCYSRKLILTQCLEELKLLILPDLKNCKYCKEPLKLGKVCFYGDSIVSCTKQSCRDKWCIEIHGEEGLELRNKLNKAVSCGVSSKGMHVTYKNGKEEWI